MSLCLGPYEGLRGWAVSYERSTPEGFRDDGFREYCSGYEVLGHEEGLEHVEEEGAANVNIRHTPTAISDVNTLFKCQNTSSKSRRVVQDNARWSVEVG